MDSHSAVVVDAVDLSADEDADPAVAPLAPVGQQVGNQQSQTCERTHAQMFLTAVYRFNPLPQFPVGSCFCWVYTA